MLDFLKSWNRSGSTICDVSFAVFRRKGSSAEYDLEYALEFLIEERDSIGVLFRHESAPPVIEKRITEFGGYAYRYGKPDAELVCIPEAKFHHSLFFVKSLGVVKSIDDNLQIWEALHPFLTEIHRTTPIAITEVRPESIQVNILDCGATFKASDIDKAIELGEVFFGAEHTKAERRELKTFFKRNRLLIIGL